MRSLSPRWRSWCCFGTQEDSLFGSSRAISWFANGLFKPDHLLWLGRGLIRELYKTVTAAMTWLLCQHKPTLSGLILHPYLAITTIPIRSSTTPRRTDSSQSSPDHFKSLYPAFSWSNEYSGSFNMPSAFSPTTSETFLVYLSLDFSLLSLRFFPHIIKKM